VRGSRADDRNPARSARQPDIAYIGQVARSAEQLGFHAALTPTSSWCEDAWILTAGLTQTTERLRFLVAFRPGLQSPTLAAQMAATYQRISGDRLLLNVVTGGDTPSSAGSATTSTSGHATPGPANSSTSCASCGPASRSTSTASTTTSRTPSSTPSHAGPASTSAARRRRRSRSPAATPTCTSRGALEPAAIERAQAFQRSSQSEGQRRMTALHNDATEDLEVSPNLWAGVGLVRGGAGTALVGSHEEAADRIEDYHGRRAARPTSRSSP